MYGERDAGTIHVSIVVQVNLAMMQMYSPVKGKLRRTHHDGVHVKFAMSERDYSVYAKVAYIQVKGYFLPTDCTGGLKAMM